MFTARFFCMKSRRGFFNLSVSVSRKSYANLPNSRKARHCCKPWHAFLARAKRVLDHCDSLISLIYARFFLLSGVFGNPKLVSFLPWPFFRRRKILFSEDFPMHNKTLDKCDVPGFGPLAFSYFLHLTESCLVRRFAVFSSKLFSSSLLVE